MATLYCYTRAIKLHRSIYRKFIINHTKLNHLKYLKYHHRSFHLNIYESRINIIHNRHLRKFWKKYTLLISLSAITMTFTNKYSSISSVSADNKTNDTNKEKEEIKDEEDDKRLEKEALEHLIQTITVPKHTWIVWIWLYLSRFTFLVYNFTPMLILAPFAYWNIFGIRNYWLNLLHDSFANGGSTFIKLGQWISMRSDIFPIEICDHSLNSGIFFLKLKFPKISKNSCFYRMRAPSHTFEETCRSDQDAFGKDLDEIFDRFYIEPTASGSIAQVHKAQICINHTESCNYFEDDMYKGNRTLWNWFWNSLITNNDAKQIKSQNQNIWMLP